MTKFQLAMDGLSKLGMIGKVVVVGGALTVVGAVSASAAYQATTPIPRVRRAAGRLRRQRRGPGPAGRGPG